MSVSRKFLVSFWGVSSKIHECLKGDLRVLKVVSKVFQRSYESFMGVLRVFQGNLKGV